MSDERGFDFGAPAERREPKAFEPPPWERDAFEKLERERAEETARSGATVVEDATRVAPVEQESAEQGAAGPSPAAGEAGAEKGEAGTSATVPESVVLEMMAGLAAEEPRPERLYSGVSLGIGIFLLALGGVLVIWAVAALIGSRSTGWIGQMGGAGLGIFGLFFFGMGAWLLHRTLKRRGVL